MLDNEVSVLAKGAGVCVCVCAVQCGNSKSHSLLTNNGDISTALLQNHCKRKENRTNLFTNHTYFTQYEHLETQYKYVGLSGLCEGLFPGFSHPVCGPGSKDVLSLNKGRCNILYCNVLYLAVTRGYVPYTTIMYCTWQ